MSGTATIGAAARTAAAPGRDLILLRRAPELLASYCVAGPEEAAGPLGDRFDAAEEGYRIGDETYEAAERRLLARAVEGVLERAGIGPEEVDVFLGGDLLNQLVSVHFALRDLGIPCLGLYSACATMAEALGVAAMLVDGGHVRRAVCAVASHFYAAERQYRYPAELGTQRLPQSQRTATGAAAFLVAAGDGARGAGPPPGERIRLTAVTVGRVRDLGVKDVSNMGAAEAPAAADTLGRHFTALGAVPYDRVVTGDLAAVGLALARDLLQRQGYRLGGRWEDCGISLYDPRRQDVKAGASGAACSALVLAARHLPDLRAGAISSLLFVGTGSLHSPTTAQQGESIPGVAHAVAMEAASAAAGAP